MYLTENTTRALLAYLVGGGDRMLRAPAPAQQPRLFASMHAWLHTLLCDLQALHA